MDEQKVRRLINETTVLLEDEAAEWTAVEALWQPYVDQGDTDAQFQLAFFYLEYGFDEGSEKELEIRELLKKAAELDHADAAYRLCNQYPAGRSETRSCSRQGSWAAWMRSATSVPSSQREIGQDLVTRFVLSSGIGAPPSGVIQTRNTISDSCSC